MKEFLALKLDELDEDSDFFIAKTKTDNLPACPTDSLKSEFNEWLDKGFCPQCGHKGEWISLALICPVHGKFAG